MICLIMFDTFGWVGYPHICHACVDIHTYVGFRYFNQPPNTCKKGYALGDLGGRKKDFEVPLAKYPLLQDPFMYGIFTYTAFGLCLW